MKAMQILLASAAMVAMPAAAQTIAITGGTVAIGDGSAPIENGTVVIRDGRIVAAGSNVAVPAGATVVDAKGKWVAAGMVAGFSSLGLVDAKNIVESNDTVSAGSPYHAAIDVSMSVNPNTVQIGNERAGGVTRAIITPRASESIFAGQGAVIDLGTDPDPMTKARAFQYVELGEAGAVNAGGTRPAAYVSLHDAFEEAEDFRRNPAGFDGRSRDSMVSRSDARALLSVIDGTMPLVVHVERATDIRSVLALSRRYPKLRLVLTGANEGWMVAREIAAAKVPVMASSLVDLPETFERMASTSSNVGRMTRAGIPVGIQYDGRTGEHIMAQFAGNLVALNKVPGATGLTWGEAFATVTSKPAQALGLDGEIGSLRPGRRADVVLWDGDPMELLSAPVAVWIDGQQQPLESRQRKLRNRYLTPTEGNLPKAYEW